MTDYRELFQIGDVITLDGLYADGTREANDTPPSQYARKPLAFWRVRLICDDGVNLQPLNEDKTVREFNDAAGDFWIRPEGFRDWREKDLV